MEELSISTQTVPGQYTVQGRLCLTFAYDSQSRQTRLSTSVQQPPLKVIRAFPIDAGGVLLHLHNLSGGVLGGDQLELAVTLEPQAYVQLTTTGATRIYRSRPGVPSARQTNTIEVQSGALLEFLPDTLIPFAGSRYQQDTRIDLAADSGLFWWETLAPGRTARGEIFAYDDLHMRLQITAQGRPLVIEHFKLTPKQQPLSSPLQFGPYTYSCSFYICRVGLESSRWTALERTLGEQAWQLSQSSETYWAVSTLVAHGLVVRALSRHSRDIPAGLLTFWRAAKEALYGQIAIPPRKIY